MFVALKRGGNFGVYFRFLTRYTAMAEEVNRAMRRIDDVNSGTTSNVLSIATFGIGLASLSPSFIFFPSASAFKSSKTRCAGPRSTVLKFRITSVPLPLTPVGAPNNVSASQTRPCVLLNSLLLLSIGNVAPLLSRRDPVRSYPVKLSR